jgi:ParB-like nuclease domain
VELLPRTTAPAHATGAVEFVSISALAADDAFRLRDEGDVSTLATSIGRLGQLTPVELRLVSGEGEERRWQVVAGFRRLAALQLLQRERVLARLHERLSDEDAWSMAASHALLTEPLGLEDLEKLRARLAATPAARWADELVDEARVRAPVSPEERERFHAFLSGAALEGAGTSAGREEDRAPGEEPAMGAEDAVGSVNGYAAPEAGVDEREEGGEGEALAGGEGAGDEAAPVEASGDAGWEGDEPAGEGAAGDGEDPEEVAPEAFCAQLALSLFEANQDLATALEAWSELPDEGRRTILEQARYLAGMVPYLERAER